MGTEDKVQNVTARPQEKQPTEFELIVRGEHSDPFGILGPHGTATADGKLSLAIRVFRPNAVEVTIVGTKNNQTYTATRIHPEGLFEADLPPTALGTAAGETVPPSAYRLCIRFGDGNVFETLDPYAFPPVLTEYDLYLSGEGTHYLKYEKLGAHVRQVAGVRSRAFLA